MTKTPQYSPYLYLPDIIALFTKLTVIGVYLLYFLVTFLTYDDTVFSVRFQEYQNAIYYLWLGLLAGFLINLVLFTNYRKNLDRFLKSREHQPALIFLAVFTVTLFAGILHIQPKFLHFATFLSALYALTWTAKYYAFESKRVTWQHPSTAGTIFQGAVAIGVSLGIWLIQSEELYRVFSWILAIVLLLEMLTIWSRFKFLSSSGFTTRMAANMMLSSHLLLFAVRFIFGIVMALVYLIWYLIANDVPLHPVVLMILIGELSERVLFFITSTPEAVLSGLNDEEQSSEDAQ